MQIVFLSNYFNHHQLYLANELYRLSNEKFIFIETSPMEKERINLGWQITNVPSYVYSYHSLDPHDKKNIDNLIDNADIVILGSAPYNMIKKRLHSKKITFLYWERIYKDSYGAFYKWPYRYFHHFIKYGRYSNLYLLCASAFTAADFAKTHTFVNKAFKWGYFPQAIKYNDVDKLIAKKEKNSLLWVGRLIDWKHPEKALNIAEKLKEEKIPFNLKIIGTGVLQNQIEKEIKRKNLNSSVSLLGSLPPTDVRKFMERSEIFLFTSDRNEGWGAVMNEAMNSACAIVASHSIGSVPFLGIHNDNCLIYQNDDFYDLYEKVHFLLKNNEERKRLGKKAYLTIMNSWNPSIASSRFIEVCKNLLQKQISFETSGPCSKAELLSDNWFQKK